MDCNITCETACKQMPEVDFSICAPKTFAGQITSLFLFNLKHPLLNELDLDEFAFRLALPQSNVSKIITLNGIGDKPEPELNEVSGAYGNVAYANKLHRVNFTIKELSDINFNMLKHFERYKKALALYKTAGGKTYGGIGIPVTINFNQVIPESSSELEMITGYITWENKLHPCRKDSIV